jgi:hypothetical protein
LLTIPNAIFSVNRRCEEFGNGQIPDLEQIPPANRTQIHSLAHSVKATIILNDNGQVFVQSNQIPNGGVFFTDTGVSYTLTFDNDCGMERAGLNDMDMFYEVVEEYNSATNARIARKFRVGGVGIVDRPIPEDIIEELIEFGFDRETSEKLYQFGIGPEIIKKLIELGISLEIIKNIVLLSEPPNFAIGKPCLVVKTTNPESIDNLP